MERMGRVGGARETKMMIQTLRQKLILISLIMISIPSLPKLQELPLVLDGYGHIIIIIYYNNILLTFVKG